MGEILTTEDILELHGIPVFSAMPNTVPTPAEIDRAVKTMVKPMGFHPDEVEALKNGFKASLQTLQELLKERDEDVIYLANELGQTLANLKSAHTEVELLHARGVELTTKAIGAVGDGDSAQKVVELASTIVEQEKYAETLQRENKTLNENYTTLNKQHAELVEWAKIATIEYTKMEEKYDSITDIIKENETLKEQLASFSISVDYRDSGSGVAGRLESLEAEIYDLTAERDELADSLTGAKRREERLRKEISFLKEKYETTPTKEPVFTPHQTTTEEEEEEEYPEFVPATVSPVIKPAPLPPPSPTNQTTKPPLGLPPLEFVPLGQKPILIEEN